MKITLSKRIFIALTILFVVSILIIIKNCYFQNVDVIRFIKVFESDKITNLSLDVSVGYLVSYIFYILQIFIPELIKKKKAESSIKFDINLLFQGLNKLNAIIKRMVIIEEDGKVLNINNAIYLKQIDSKNEDFVWCFKVNSVELINDNNYFIRILKQLDKIKSISLYEYNDIEVIIYIDDILNLVNKVYRGLKHIINMQIANNYAKELYEDIKMLDIKIKEFNKFMNKDKIQIMYKDLTIAEIDKFNKYCIDKKEVLEKANGSEWYIKIDFKEDNNV